MPQEMRRPDKRTEAYNPEVSKILEFNTVLNTTQSPLLQQWAADVLWPSGITIEEKQMVINSCNEINNYLRAQVDVN